jgi:hypothetical protein
MKKINVIPTEVSIYRDDESPVYGEGNIRLKLDSAGAGYYFRVSQEDNSFEIDYKEIIALKEAADILLEAVGGPPND